MSFDVLQDMERVELTTASSFAEELVDVDSTKVLSLRNSLQCTAEQRVSFKSLENWI